MKLWMKIVAALLVLIILGGVFVYKYVYNKKHPDYESASPEFTMTANAIYDGFKRNPDGFAKLYNGKVGIISGKLSKVEKSDTLVTAVFVFSQGDFGDEGVRCTMLRKFNDEAERLQPDGEVQIKGYCSGFNDDVIFDKCSIVIH